MRGKRGRAWSIGVLLLLIGLTGCSPDRGDGSTSSPAETTVASSPIPSSTATPAATTKPDCSKGVTPATTEGPYFTPGSPRRSSLLEEGMKGTRLTLTGFVVNERCEPIAQAKVDFWQADADGNYDNEGFRLRGHQLTDSEGRYMLETVIPGEYSSRTSHLHMKVSPPGGEVLTTQLYFPDARGNQSDRLFRSELLITYESTGEPRVGRFDFVL